MTAAVRLQEEPAIQDRVEIAPVQERLFRMLNETFGQNGWRVNEDMRFCSEIECHPFDVLAPIEAQEALLPKVAALQAQLSRELNIQVYFVLTSPD